MVLSPSGSSFSSLRWPIMRFAKLGTAYPIECIVTIFCAATLVYFQLIKVRRAHPRARGIERRDEALFACRRSHTGQEGTRWALQG